MNWDQVKCTERSGTIDPLRDINKKVNRNNIKKRIKT